MWMQLRHETLAAFIVQARTMGFAQVELSHVLTAAQLSALPTELYGRVRVLHHPCPNPGSLPDLCDLDEGRRHMAVTAAQESLAWAARLGAQVVVLHLGRVAVDPRWEGAVRARWLQGEWAHDVVASVSRLRAAQAAPHLEAAHRSLDALLPLAREWGLQLGIENGEWIMALPTIEEARRLLEAWPAQPVGLWVDTGHATILERVGVGSLLGWLQLAPQRLLGLHYHDVRGLRDHLIPGRGTIDWQQIAPHVPPHALPTCEFDWYYTPEEIVQGATRLATQGLVAFPAPPSH